MTLVSLAPGFDTDKETAHGYLEVYDRLFGTPTRLLEIGVHEGESLRLWMAAFPGCDVWGLDSYMGVPVVAGATVWIGDAYTPQRVASLPGLFDVIVDDGPHTIDSMLFTAAHYTGLLSPGGLLVIEDIPNPDWIPLIAAALPEHLSRWWFAVDRRHLPGVAPDSLLLIAPNP